MQITINVPDNLPSTKVNQLIKELEQKLTEEAKFLDSSSTKKRQVYAHLFPTDDLNLPSREELYER